MQTEPLNIQRQILKVKECGLEMFRLLVFVNGKLSLCSKHMSEQGARNRYAEYVEVLKKGQAL